MARSLELEDLTSFISVSDPQLSPDLGKIAFVAVKADEKLDDFSTTVWMVDRATGEPVSFLSGWKDHHPRWSPNGRQLLFLSNRGLKEGEKGNAL